MGLSWKNLFLLSPCLAWGCAFSSTDYCVLSGRVLKPDGKPAPFCDVYLARSPKDLGRGNRPFSQAEREAFHVPGENLYRFTKTDRDGRFQTVFRVRRHSVHPEVYYGHPLPRLYIQVESAPGKWARFTMDTEWGDWNSSLEGALKPMDLGGLLLGREPLSLPEPPPLKGSYMKALTFPPLETGEGQRLVFQAEKPYRAGRFLEAARTYRMASAAEPRSALAFFLTAESLFRAGKLEEALSFGRQAVTLDPWVGKGHFLLALILEKLGRKEEGLAELFRACQLDPDLQEARDRLEILEPRARPFRKGPLVLGKG